MTLFRNKYRIKTARLKHWDYARAGWYFITCNTAGRVWGFGAVEQAEMRLSPLGECACDCWLEIPQHTKRTVWLDEFVVMPDHLHGILALEGEAPPAPRRDPHNPYALQAPRAGSVNAIMRSYKSAVTYWARRNGMPDFAWQSRFYDHIIRSVAELERIRQYIRNNPAKWEAERNNPDGLWR